MTSNDRNSAPDAHLFQTGRNDSTLYYYVNPDIDIDACGAFHGWILDESTGDRFPILVTKEWLFEGIRVKSSEEFVGLLKGAGGTLEDLYNSCHKRGNPFAICETSFIQLWNRVPAIPTNRKGFKGGGESIRISHLS